MIAFPAILVALGILAATALVTFVVRTSDRAALWLGTAGSLVACVLGGIAAVIALMTGQEDTLRQPWSLPLGEFHVGLDSLSAFFLLCIFLVGGLAALYGFGYLPGHRQRRRLAPALIFFNLLLLSMASVVLARDGVLFVMAWELMSLASFFLITFEHDRPEVRRAGQTYLIASQLGVAFVLALFCLLAARVGSFDLGAFAAAGLSGQGLANLCFVLSLVGFGSKAGFWPLHVWLPDAHPAAPSHVSALMSGVMIKMGIYGLLRSLSFLGPPPPVWGMVVIGIGVVSGITGVLHALTQHDYKRLLAYHSVENIGIIALGIGIGLLGQAHGQSIVSFLGFAGALLHVLNHGIFKGLLFQAAGSILHATGTRDTDSLGGLGRRMPVTALAFLAGSIAICGLPPMNGFVSEWLVYLGAFQGGTSLATRGAVSSLAVIPALALIGGMAAACFVKVFSVIFLGQPRTSTFDRAHEPPFAMRLPMILGALLCLAIGLWPAWVLQLVAPTARSLTNGLAVPPLEAMAPVGMVSRLGVGLVALVAGLALLRHALLRGREVRSASTWACGYRATTPRMQYTSSSFIQPLLAPFSTIVHRRVEEEGPAGFFPTHARYEEHLGDVAGERWIVPASRWIVGVLSRFRVLQHGRIQFYLAYVFITLILLLLWQLGAGEG